MGSIWSIEREGEIERISGFGRSGRLVGWVVIYGEHFAKLVEKHEENAKLRNLLMDV